MLKLFSGSPRRATVDTVAGAKSPAPAVRLMHAPKRLPQTAIEQQLMSTLQEGGTISLSRLVNAVATDLYTNELRKGAGVLDIGLFGSRLFTGEVLQELEAGDGILWVIEAGRDNR